MKIRAPEGVYKPREDSFLLQKEVEKFCKKHKPLNVLDMGTGTGILAITAKLAGAKVVTASDLNLAALAVAEENAWANKAEIEFVFSDLFSGIYPEDRFDLIIFNPPYLEPVPPIDAQWSGGKEFIEKFIAEAKVFLKPGGSIMIIYSSLTKLDNPEIKVIARQKMPDYEELRVGLVTQKEK